LSLCFPPLFTAIQRNYRPAQLEIVPHPLHPPDLQRQLDRQIKFLPKRFFLCSPTSFTSAGMAEDGHLHRWRSHKKNLPTFRPFKPLTEQVKRRFSKNLLPIHQVGSSRWLSAQWCPSCCYETALAGAATTSLSTLCIISLGRQTTPPSFFL
jgi:hypothetical protein